MKETDPPNRILLIKPSSFGDVIHTLPVVSALHRQWPQAELRWLIAPAWRSLVEQHPGVAGTILFPREKFRGLSGWMRSLAWMRTLGDWKPDLALDLQGLFRSALFAKVSGAPRILGLSDAREGAGFFYTDAARVRPEDHAVRRYLGILELLGIPLPKRSEFLLPQGKLPVGFDHATPYLVLHPFSRGEGKSLTPLMIRAFAQGAKDSRIVLVGHGKLISDLPTEIEDWSNRTDLLELIGILRGAAFVVSSDSGPMHLATAIQPAKTVAIHLWSDPLKVGPYATESLVWKAGQVATVSELDDSWRSEGLAPTEAEMEQLGYLISGTINPGSDLKTHA